MTTQPQPEALRLAEAMEQRVIPRWVHATGETPRQSGFAPDAECQAAADELLRLHAECEALRADAERYRWLRDEECAIDTFTVAYWNAETAEEIDAAIDAARAAKEQSNG